MKRLLHSAIPLALFAAATVGCSPKEETSTAAAAAPTPAAANGSAAAAAPTTAKDSGNTAATAQKGARLVEITGNDQMKFSLTRIEAAPGEELQVKLVNVGTLPKEAMGHNFVLLQKNVNPQTFASAALTAKATEYIPANLKDQVIAHTKLLGPKENDTITFKAPTEPGEYPYICSFPAHAMAGMKGVLVVR